MTDILKNFWKILERSIGHLILLNMWHHLLLVWRSNFSRIVAFFSAFRSEWKLARRDGGVSFLRQICELVWLRLGPGKLTLHNYYELRLYRRELPLHEKSKYIHTRMLWNLLPAKKWKTVGDDKLLTYAVLSQQGFRTPDIFAIVHVGRDYGKARSLRNSTEVKDFCCCEGKFPCVAKPIYGMFSRGVYVVEAVDQVLGTIHFRGGASQSLHQFSDELSSNQLGYMFQELLRPHPSIVDICGDNLCTVRMVTIFGESTVRLLGAYWKIAVEPNVADNYVHKGNLLALVSLNDGSVEHCTTGSGINFRSVEMHPVTHQVLCGFHLPDWREAVKSVLEASRAFPGITLQSWDVALTDKGPILLELNPMGNLVLPQIAEQRGLYDGDFRAFIDRYKS